MPGTTTWYLKQPPDVWLVFSVGGLSDRKVGKRKNGDNLGQKLGLVDKSVAEVVRCVGPEVGD